MLLFKHRVHPHRVQNTHASAKQAHMQIQPPTHTDTHTHKPTQTHTDKHTRTQNNTHTHTGTYSYTLNLWKTHGIFQKGTNEGKKSRRERERHGAKHFPSADHYS